MSDEKLIEMFNDVISEIDRQGSENREHFNKIECTLDEHTRILKDHSFQLEQMHHEVNACKVLRYLFYSSVSISSLWRMSRTIPSS